MATVVNVPADTRFSQLGAGFGNVLQKFLDEKEDQERSVAQQELLTGLIDDLGLSGVSGDLAAQLSADEAGLDITQQLDILSAVKRESERRRVEEGISGISQRVISGDLTPEDAGIEALQFMPDELTSVLGIVQSEQDRALRERQLGIETGLAERGLAIDERRLTQAEEQGEAELGQRQQRIDLDTRIFESQEERREDEATATANAISRFAAGEIDATQLATELVGAQPSTAGQIVPSLVRSEMPSDPDRQTITFSKTQEDGTIVTTTRRLPVGVDPAETPQGRRLIQNGWQPVKIDSGSIDRERTQFERQIDTVIELQELEGEQAEALATNLVANRNEAIKQLNEVFTTGIEGSFEREFATQRNRITYNLALEEVEARLLAGDGLGVAIRQSIDTATEKFFTGEWIPADVADRLRDREGATTEERDLNSAANLALWLMSVNDFDSAEAQHFLERWNGPQRDPSRPGEPKFDQTDIQTIMSIVRRTQNPPGIGGGARQKSGGQLQKFLNNSLGTGAR